jgi:hypothetical protein
MKKVYFGSVQRICACTLLVLLSVFAFAQSRTITGKVTDPATGAGVSNVSVLVKGTTVGVTDRCRRVVPD